MKEKNPHLLPSGLYDLLPPEARLEADATARLLSCFESFGYAQVSPPLLEFEASLLAGRGETLSTQTFRVMDPLSQAMMGFRADITFQVARIATSRMKSAPRPLRLCYGGPILRIKPDPLMNERQLMQAGIELIGTDSWAADAEVMIVAAEALRVIAAGDISIDINLPGLLGDLCPEAQNDADLRARIKDAVQRRDMAALGTLPLASRALLVKILEAAGPAEKALANLSALGRAHTKTLQNVVAQVQKTCPQVTLTLDPLEYRGFDYHHGIGFSIFVGGLRHELVRGGRYSVDGDSATGFTLYVTHLLRLLKAAPDKKRVLVPLAIAGDDARALREQGWVTVTAMTDDLRAEARRLGIAHAWRDGKAADIS
jgi:ATP phosphoribosyltransferase regulatory subunit